MKDTRPQWLIDLDVVATTPEQARQIIRRNRALLRELKKAEPRLLKKQIPEGWAEIFKGGDEYQIVVPLGCPHCSTMKACGSCSWSKHKSRSCEDASFGELCLDEIVEIAPLCAAYQDNYAELRVNGELCDFKTQEIRDCIADIRKFLEAHVTWGKDVIRRAKG